MCVLLTNTFFTGVNPCKTPPTAFNVYETSYISY